jgi:predicted RNase H-like nuclease (RuvC/YqgF family)
LENIRRIELQHELELLKTLHAKEILEFQFQIRSILDGSSHDAYQRSQLEKTCEDLRGTVSDLSQSLNKLRQTNEKDVLARTELAQECAQLRAKVTTHDKTLSDLSEAKSKITQLESQLRISQEAQEKMASELSRSQSARENDKSNKDGARELRSPQSPSLLYMISSLSAAR